MLSASVLDDRAIIALGGAEARDFLQGLITNDMAGCGEGRAIYAALLTPQGKILFDFFVVPGGVDIWLLDCAAARANDLLKRLMLYRLRAKMGITARPDLAVAAVWNDEPLLHATPDVIAYRDPRLAALGLRATGPREALMASISDISKADYQDHRLALGVPDSADLPPDEVFALDAGMEELHGVNFRKGCYVGQEVTSRMKHRATARRRFVMADIAGDNPAPGTSVQAEGRELGTLASGNNGRALALVRLDRLAEAEKKHAAINAGGRELTLRKPGWFHG
jgi:tRNA-modifying protein YgfZ